MPWPCKVDSPPVNIAGVPTLPSSSPHSLSASLSSEAKAFTSEVAPARRRSFNMLTDELYTLATAVRYDGQVIYHIKCPMFSGAYNRCRSDFWLEQPYPKPSSILIWE